MFWFFFIDVGDTYIAQVCECVCVIAIRLGRPEKENHLK